MSSHWNREGGLPKHTSLFCFLLPGSLPHCPLRLYLKTTTTKRRSTSWPDCMFLLVTNTSNAQYPSPSPRCCSSLLEKPPTSGPSVAQLSEPPQALRYTSSALPHRLLPQRSASASSWSFSLSSGNSPWKMVAMKTSLLLVSLLLAVVLGQTEEGHSR